MEEVETLVSETDESAETILDVSQSDAMSSAPEIFEEASVADISEEETEEETTAEVVLQNVPYTDNQSYLWLIVIVIIGFACVSAIHRAGGFMRKLGE